jgi:hypothetical protein
MTERPRWFRVPPSPVADEEGLVEFLGHVGICLWTPTTGLDFPNLAEKMDLKKPDDIWDTWFWKDDLHEQKRLYYGKLLAGKPTFVAMDFLPTVIAALGDMDPHNLHERGALSAEALRVYEALLRRRQMATGDLRREAGLAEPSSKAAYEKAVTSLGATFQICKTGITGRTRGTYGYRWGLVEDWAPEVLGKAARIRPHDAARAVVARLHEMGVDLRPKDLRRLFGWDAETVESASAP